MGRPLSPVARAISFPSSSGPIGFLRHRIALVRPLRIAQSGFSPRFYLATQFSAIPHSCIPTPAAILVLCTRPSCSIPPLVCDGNQRDIHEMESS